MTTNIIPVTKARGRLGELADEVSAETLFILTKGGLPKAALVDIDYLTDLQNEVKNFYSQTFIDPSLMKYTRDFSNEEIERWEKEDAL